MAKLTILALARAAAPTATATGTGVDVSDFLGNAKVILDAAQPAAGQTLDVKLQHSDTLGSGYVDTGVTFTQVTNAAAAYEVKDLSVDQFKKYVRTVATIAGSATALPHQVTLVGNKAF